MFQIPPNLELEIEALPYVLHNDDLRWIGWPQPGGRLNKVANGRRKTIASRRFLRPAVYSFEQGCQMQSARTQQERVQLVNDNERGRDAAISARMQMAMKEPTTPSGAGAMISYMAAELVDDDFEDDSWHAIALKTVSAALTRTSKRT